MMRPQPCGSICRKRLAREAEAGGEVRVDDGLPVGISGFEDRLADGAAGVVDQDVEPAVAVLQGGDGGDGGGGVGDIEAEDAGGGGAAFGKGGGAGLEGCVVAAVKKYVGAGGGEGLGHVPAEAARRAGDQREPAGEVEVWVHPGLPLLGKSSSG